MFIEAWYTGQPDQTGKQFFSVCVLKGKIPKQDKTILLGDSNSRVDKNSHFQNDTSLKESIGMVNTNVVFIPNTT